MSQKPSSFTLIEGTPGCPLCGNPNCKGNCKESLALYGLDTQQSIGLGSGSTLFQILEKYDNTIRITDAKNSFLMLLDLSDFENAPIEILHTICSQLYEIAETLDRMEALNQDSTEVLYENPDALSLFETPHHQEIFQNPSLEELQSKYLSYRSECISLLNGLTQTISILTGKNLKQLAKHLSKCLGAMDNILAVKKMQEISKNT